MTQESDYFLEEQKDWSRRKLVIIRGYLDSFLKILGSNKAQSCVYFIDGFAGAGQHIKDCSKGSPLLSAELAQKYRNENKTYRLNCINVEENEENYNNLVLVTAPFNSFVNNYFGSFSSNLDLILRQIGNCPALFFIDPFGVKGLDWVAIEKIACRKSPTDIWIRFDHRNVRRLSGFFDSGSRGADSKFQNLLNLYGINRPDNLYQLLKGNSPEERINKALALYVGKLEREFIKSRKSGFSAAFPIISIEGKTKYHLVFATAHHKAAMLASQTLYSADRNRAVEKLEYFQRKTGQPFLIPPEPTDDELFTFISEQLYFEISRLCKGQQLSRQDIYLRLLRDDEKKWFGRFSGAHFNKALSLLESGQNPCIQSKDGPNSQDKTIFSFR